MLIMKPNNEKTIYGHFSDLDPMQAPQWAVRIIMTEDPNCLLGNSMKNNILLLPYYVNEYNIKINFNEECKTYLGFLLKL